MTLLKTLFKTPQPMIGVVHLLPLPTSPRWGGSLEQVIARAEQEATALATGGANGIIVENYHDAPFCRDRVDPAVVSAMTVVIQRLKNLIALPIGLNVLRNDGHSALGIAACVGAPFIRVNVLCGAMVTDQGVIEGDAHQLLRYRRELGCDVKIFADVLVKHATTLGSMTLKAAVLDTVERSLADGIILSGWATGQPPVLDDLALARQLVPGIPVLIGSGATADNISALIQYADGVIVSSALKRPTKFDTINLANGGLIDPMRVRAFVDAMHKPTLRAGIPVIHR